MEAILIGIIAIVLVLLLIDVGRIDRQGRQ